MRPLRVAYCHPDRTHYALGKCRLCWNKDHDAARDPIKRGADHFKWNLKKYGITIKQYNTMLVNQKWVCLLCGNPQPSTKKYKRLVVDHRPGSNQARGLLCTPCNSVLSYIEKYGWFDIDWLKKASIYLQHHNQSVLEVELISSRVRPEESDQ